VRFVIIIVLRFNVCLRDLLLFVYICLIVLFSELVMLVFFGLLILLFILVWVGLCSSLAASLCLGDLRVVVCTLFVVTLYLFTVCLAWVFVLLGVCLFGTVLFLL